MKKLVVIMFILALFLPPASASVITGWLEVPFSITLPDYTLRLQDVSADGSGYLIQVESANNSTMRYLKVGDSLSLMGSSFLVDGIVMGERIYAHLSLDYPYLLEGESMKIGNYSISLLSSRKDGLRIAITEGNETREFTTPKIEYGPLKINATPFPEVYSGYLKEGESIDFYSRSLLFEKVRVENSSGEYVNVLEFRENGSTYEVQVGETVETSAFVVSVERIIVNDSNVYAKVNAYLKGAFVDVSVNPGFENIINEGETVRFGPYLIGFTYIDPSHVYLRITNLCGEELTGALITPQDVFKALNYRELEVSVLSMSLNATPRRITVITFVSNKSILKYDDIPPKLDVTVNSPSRAVQYESFPIEVTVKNNENKDVENVEVNYVPSSNVRLLNGSRVTIPKIGAGSSYRLKFYVAVDEEFGNLTLGNIIVKAPSPKGLNCNNGTIEIASLPVRAYIEKAELKYNISITAPEAVGRDPFDVRVEIRNSGNVKVPVTFRMPVEKFAVVKLEEVSFNYPYVEGSLYLAPNQSKEIKLSLIALTENNLSIEGQIIFGNRTIARLSVPLKFISEEAPQENVTPNQNVTCTPRVVYVNRTEYVEKKVPIEVEKIVNQTITVPYTPLKSKIVFSGIGMVIGAAVIIIIAWIQSRTG
ncbi:hypothetical protein A3L12_07530 [Thermococcus sp. P6]|uniref:COG1470 family protein n=1 Tax=Thermococcus sp. P6 TaxID=122420 RepID=UPI000B5A1E74|nr:hypothetical protein [Thermococcus sp. P6]ASJ11156.1 hypothetical protein A3L12_07530 [Thermococcus sp. P6]